MSTFGSFYGTVTKIEEYNIGTTAPEGCFQLMTVQNAEGSIVNFVITPVTYFVDRALVSRGDRVIGWYDANAPAILIYPPQYQALVIARLAPGRNVKVDHFNSQLISSDGALKLNLAPYTRLRMENGQAFTGNPADRDLIVEYGATTRSIPAQTTPYRIIAMCPQNR